VWGGDETLKVFRHVASQAQRDAVGLFRKCGAGDFTKAE
jgi:hypothetical protein